MRMKIYKRRKIVCRMIRKAASCTMWIAILLTLGTAGRIGLGMSTVQGVRMLLAETAVMIIAWIFYNLSRYLERYIITFSGTGEKETKK
ncbi:MAG: hypothetical protein K2O65_17855 [Lachnospiraceae bacterium]|nr:hypothetical protein [Lachnospiraceae bacterium]